MQYLALVSFSGNKLSMAEGQVCEISDPVLIDDLTHAGFIIPYEATIKPKTTKPKRKGKTKNED